KTLASEAKVDACLFLSSDKRPSHSMKYLIGTAGDSAALLTFKRKQPIYFHSPLEGSPRLEGIEVRKREAGAISKALKQAKATSIGVNYDELTKREHDTLKTQLRKQLGKVTFKDVSTNLSKRRQVKTTKEINNLKEAITRTERLIKELIKKLPEMTYEYEGIIYLKKRVLELGDELAFEPIVASGNNSKKPHYEPDRKSRLTKGFCIIDFGVKHKGYCADITRTIYIGTPSKADIDFYNKVKDEQQRLEQELKAGTAKAKPSFEMIHALGHGIGLEVHEQPLVGHEKLEENMTIAVEPAIYKRQGVRIEDNYLVTAKGLKRLSRSSRELTIIHRN
ncbi:MAG: M24 family metallopeptidase, partial [Candidatus Woesearchaeota archaeon]